MPVATVDTQQGAVISLPGSPGAHNILRIGRVKRSTPVIDSTHLGTSGQRTKLFGDLIDVEQFDVEVQNGPGLAEPTIGTVGTCQITGPVPPGGAAGEIQAGSAAVVAIQESEYNAGSEAIQTKIFTVCFNGGANGGTIYTRTAATAAP